MVPTAEDHAKSLGVRKREDSLKQNSTEPSNVGTAPSAEDHAKSLGVQERGGDRGNQYQSGKVQSCTLAPTAEDHAENLGVSVRTVKGWERDRKEIVADPELKYSTKHSHSKRHTVL